jgi:hypothetical protein
LNAILLYNEYLSQNSMMIVAAMINSAFNVILDQQHNSVSTVSGESRKALKKEVTDLIDSVSYLETNDKQAYKALIGGKIDQGTESMVDKIKSLLVHLGIIEEPFKLNVENRINFLNRTRNLMTHAGKIPKLPGLDKEQSLRYAGSIVTGVIPEICCMAIGDILGIYGTVTSYNELFRDNLKAFFEEGIWRDWKLENETFDEWFYGC